MRIFGFPLSTMLDWCKRTAGRYGRFAGTGHLRMVGREDQFEGAQPANASQPLYVDFEGDRVELNELIKILRIGDRIRVFCDDGVLVAEKISHHQLKLIHVKTMSELVH
ncbi:MAG TPA: hypothetical protein VJN92_11780 [Candidatus Acidoferrum sp.]|nr:hypothetical protein [Candidatus Acidoferrum sp.]